MPDAQNCRLEQVELSLPPSDIPCNGPDEIKNTYRYSRLAPGGIRLLRLMPHKDESASVQCQLFDYPLRESGNETQLYEALSYVWGSSDKDHSISVDGCLLRVTANLHAALLHLRNRFLERIMWIDAVCINQDDDEERGQQVRYMAEIYSRASRVVVWLGEPAAGSDEALEGIRVAAIEKSAQPSGVTEQTKQAIQSLLQRAWFGRIWVLQEVAAARNVLIKCGHTEIDGFVFCSGLQSLHVWSQSRARPVTYLIKGAIFRPRRTTPVQSGRFTLGIGSLGELIDMYHSHEATEWHDRVFALLGMASDDLSGSGILPDYKVSWAELFQQLNKFLLGGQVSVKTWPEMDLAVVSGKGRILGRVSVIEDTGLGSGPQVVITQTDSAPSLGPEMKLTLPPSVKPAHTGDIVCLLEGASRPMIVRPFKDYFSAVLIALPRDIPITRTDCLREFLIVWDWEKPFGKSRGGEEYSDFLSSWAPEHSREEFRTHSTQKITRLWNAASIMHDAGEYEEAEERFRTVVEASEREHGSEHRCTLMAKDELALVYVSMKQWEKAETLFEQVVQTRMMVQGADHRETISSMANMASRYRDCGDARKAENVEAMMDVVGRQGEFAQTTETVVARIAGSFDEKMMKLLLVQRENEVQITEAVVIAAAENKESGERMLELLLDRKGSRAQVTEGVVTAVARNTTRGEVMRYLLDWEGSEVQITEGIVAAAAGNTSCGYEVMKHLLDRKGSEVQITEGVIAAAAGNTSCGVEVLKLLLDRKGSEFQITERVIAAAESMTRGNEVVKPLLGRRGSEVRITEGAVIQIIKSFSLEIMELLLNQERGGVQITEAIVMAATGNRLRGMRVMHHLDWARLKRRQQEPLEKKRVGALASAKSRDQTEGSRKSRSYTGRLSTLRRPMEAIMTSLKTTRNPKSQS